MIPVMTLTMKMMNKSTSAEINLMTISNIINHIDQSYYIGACISDVCIRYYSKMPY